VRGCSNRLHNVLPPPQHGPPAPTHSPTPTVQMFPYGWRLPNGETLRGFNYREIVLASECKYMEWTNTVRENAFLRRIDFPHAKP
jgi:hypothetical protein